MPTPRPIIVASVGATEGTAMTWPSRPIAESPTASAKAAVTIGVPIAIRLPKTSARITIAETLPMSSLSPVSGDESTEPIDPPTATSMPAFVAGCVASRIAWASRSVMNPSRP